MSSQLQTSLLELQKQWKARAQAKQKWLEQSLAQPAESADDAAWRTTWIKEARNMVKRAQDEIKHHAALMDAYTEHLTVLETTLIAAGEPKRSTEAPAKSAETAEPKRSTGAPANLNAETAEQKRGPEVQPNLNVETGMAAPTRLGDTLKRRHA